MSYFTSYQLHVFTAALSTAAGPESTTWYLLFLSCIQVNVGARVALCTVVFHKPFDYYVTPIPVQVPNCRLSLCAHLLHYVNR